VVWWVVDNGPACERLVMRIEGMVDVSHLGCDGLCKCYHGCSDPEKLQPESENSGKKKSEPQSNLKSRSLK